MVCSACGQERPAGDRFCAMCGTPLPHRQLSTPGAQNTVNLSHRPLETSAPDGHSLAVAVEGPNAQRSYGDESGAGTLATETSRSANPVSQEVADPPGETFDRASVLEAPETQLENPTFLPPRGQAEVIATTAEAPASQTDVSDFLEGLANAPAEPPKPVEAEHFPWMDDVLQQIELEAAKTSAQGDERPQFLDLLGDLSLPAVEPEAPPSNIASPTPAVISTGPVVRRPVGGSSGRKWRTRFAIAAVLTFALLGAMEWLSRRSDAIMGPLEMIKMQARNLEPSNRVVANSGESRPSAGPADPNTSSQAIQTGEQLKPQAPNSTADMKVPATAPSENPGGRTNVPANAAAPVQGPPASQNQQTATVKNMVPGEHESIRAEHARTAAARSVWLWKATAKGNPDAPLQLAEMYVKGDGVPRSCEQAVVLLKTAALNNNAQACNRLATMYTIGICVTRNHVKAYRWLSAALAADPVSQSAQENRELIWQQMTPEERTLAEKYR